MAKIKRETDDFVKMYVKSSARRMAWGMVIILAIMGLALFISFPACARYDTVESVRESAGKYYLTFRGESGVFGMWSEKQFKPGDRVCVRPTFAQ